MFTDHQICNYIANITLALTIPWKVEHSLLPRGSFSVLIDI